MLASGVQGMPRDWNLAVRRNPFAVARNRELPVASRVRHH